MAVVVAVVNLLSYALQYGILRRVASDMQFRARLITRHIIRELSGYCFSLTIWSFSMLLINGLDLLLVGRFQFDAVTPYSVAATLITFLAGVQNAIFGVIMPHAAQLHAREDAQELGNLLVKTTRLGVLLLLLTGLPLIAFASPIVKIWIGLRFAASGGSILTILVIGNVVRLISTPFISILIGTGQQRLVVLTPVMEGLTNLALSIGLGAKYGAIGVAWGTLIGGVAAVTANIGYNLPRVQDSIRCSRFRYSFQALLVPALCGLPVYLALAVAALFKSPSPVVLAPALVLSFCACGMAIFRSGIKDIRPS